MVKFSDFIIELILIFLFFISSVFMLATTEQIYLIIIPLLLYLYLHFLIKRNKKISKYINSDLEKLGYEIINERPLKLSEIDIGLNFSVNINNTPVSRFNYIRQFARVFKVKNKTGEIIEINTVVRRNWDSTNTIIIKNV